MEQIRLNLVSHSEARGCPAPSAVQAGMHRLVRVSKGGGVGVDVRQCLQVRPWWYTLASHALSKVCLRRGAGSVDKWCMVGGLRWTLYSAAWKGKCERRRTGRWGESFGLAEDALQWKRASWRQIEDSYVGAAKLAHVHICQHRVFNAGIKIKTSQMFSKHGCGGYFSGLFLTLKTLFARAYTTPVRRDLDCFMRWFEGLTGVTPK